MSGAAWTAAGRLSGTLGLVLVLGAVTRILSPEDAGVYVVYQSSAILGAIFAGFGVGPIVIRLIHACFESHAFLSLRQGVLRVLLLNLLGGTVVAICGTTLVLTMAERIAHGHLAAHIEIAISWMFLSVLSQTISEIFRGLGRFGWAAIIGGQSGGMILNPLLALTITGLGSINRIDLASVLQLQVGLMSVLLLCSVGRLAMLLNKLPTSENTSIQYEEPTFRWLVIQSWPIAVTQSLVLGVVPLNILILGSVGTTTNAVLFSAAYQIMMLIAAPLQILNAALPPFITELFGGGKKRELESLLRFSATAAGIPALAALSVVMFRPGQTLDLCFGPEFRDASTALIILVAANTVFVFCGSCGLTLQLTGHQRLTMWNSIVTVSIYLLVLPTMITQFGLAGAAICAGGRIVIGNLICLLLVKKHVGIWGIATLWPKQVIGHMQTMRQFAKARVSI